MMHHLCVFAAWYTYLGIILIGCQERKDYTEGNKSDCEEGTHTIQRHKNVYSVVIVLDGITVHVQESIAKGKATDFYLCYMFMTQVNDY